MNNFIGNFVGFEGRLNRQAWWLSFLALVVVGIVINFILGSIMGTGMMMSLSDLANPATLQKLAWQNLIVAAITTYPSLALSIKRRHDRNNNGYDAAGLILLGLLYSLLNAFGLVPMGGVLTMVLGLVFLVLGIWVIVQVGFLKGTAGANNYGPDPLQG